MPRPDTIIDEIAAQQGWSDQSILQLLKNFIDSRSSYWPEEKSMIDDLRSFLQNVANEENSWRPFRDEDWDDWEDDEDDDEEDDVDEDLSDKQ